MNNKIVISYFKGPQPNFGDEIGPYIIRHLTDTPLLLKDCYVPFKELLRGVVSELFKGRSMKIPFLYRRYLPPFKSHLMAVGSILGLANRWSVVWGCGFMKQTDCFRANINNVHAVRGYITMKKIQESYPWFSCPIGDPALLLPIIYPHTLNPQKEIAIIPHFKEYEHFYKTYSDKYDLIDLRTDDVEGTINAITSYKYILTTSLHGLIVAHAYGIPALWMEYSGLEEGTEGLKFYDYLSSVGIKSYEPYRNIDSILVSKNNAIKLFDKSIDLALPKRDISEIQEALLKVAPFALSHCYNLR